MAKFSILSFLFFTCFNLLLPTALVGIQLIFAPLYYAGNKYKTTYKSIIRITQKTFGGMIVFLTVVLLPGTELVLTGDYEDMKTNRKSILISNHQMYPDWIYIWMLAHKFNRHGDLKIMLINALKYVPIYGIGMQFFEFIFMKQKLSKDCENILNLVNRQKSDYKDFPLWMLIFPEGTLNTPENRIKSREYGKKNSIEEKPRIITLPKTTGTFIIADAFLDQVDVLYDITVGYSGITIDQCAYDEYLLENVYFKGKYPKSIHIHVKKYLLRDIPGLNTPSAGNLLHSLSLKGSKTEDFFDESTNNRRNLFSKWLTTVFMEKDERMIGFYNNKEFIEDTNSITCPINIQPQDWITTGSLIFLVIFMFPFTKLFYWIISIFVKI